MSIFQKPDPRSLRVSEHFHGGKYRQNDERLKNPKITPNIAEITEKEFDAYINGFARGPFFVMQEAARNLKDNGRGINISSVISELRPPCGAPYAGAKSALEAFSDTLAQELAPRGITVNVIAPGAVETKLLRALPSEVQGMVTQRTPLGVGRPSDIAGIAAFLASEGGAWITAAKYRVDGGIR